MNESLYYTTCSLNWPRRKDREQRDGIANINEGESTENNRTITQNPSRGKLMVGRAHKSNEITSIGPNYHTIGLRIHQEIHLPKSGPNGPVKGSTEP
uniref:Uncharacterized protein n=1 Tax=Oryza sativa subsp. japonica TaxID=39947 RepID=Q109Q9_ORYSJ|nr:hypothetical protein LOC_Os10g25544 [Oryza sativa Japonica Group]